MSDAITYCERCEHMIMPADLAGGSCLRYGHGMLCATCARELSPEQRAALAHAAASSTARAEAKPGGHASSSRAGAASERRHGAGSGGRAAAPASSRIPIVAVGAGLVIGLVSAVIVTRGPAPTRESAAQPVSSMPAAPTPPAPGGAEVPPAARAPREDPGTRPGNGRTAAARRLDEIRAMITPDLERSDEIVGSLRYFATDFEGAPEVASAQRLLREVEAARAAAARSRICLVRWEFDSAPSLDGWTTVRDVGSLRVDGGCLAGEITGVDPILHSSPSLSLELRSGDRVFVGLRNATSLDEAQVFFVTAEDGVWNEAKSARFPITAHDAAHTEYVVDLPQNPAWRGTLMQLRFDPVCWGAPGGTFSVDYIRIQTGPAAASAR